MCVPTARAESVIVALPPLSAHRRTEFVPSTANCTVPPLSNVPEAGVTVAVKVTVCPNADGFSDEVTAVVVDWRWVDRLAAAERAAAAGEVGVAAVGGRDRVRAHAQGRVRDRGLAAAQASPASRSWSRPRRTAPCRRCRTCPRRASPWP